MSLVWWLTLALLKWAVLSEKKLTIALLVMAAVLITAIWAVEYRDRGTSVVPVSPIKASAKTTIKAKAPTKTKAKVKVKVKAKKHKHVSRSHTRTFSAPTSGSNRRIGKRLAAEHGWTGEEWVCLNNLWTKESGWSTRSSNSSGTAWGIPQALPGSKMRSAGSDWRTNPATQITWGIGYIEHRYRFACNAWAHWQSHNWY